MNAVTVRPAKLSEAVTSHHCIFRPDREQARTIVEVAGALATLTDTSADLSIGPTGWAICLVAEDGALAKVRAFCPTSNRLVMQVAGLEGWGALDDVDELAGLTLAIAREVGVAR